MATKKQPAPYLSQPEQYINYSALDSFLDQPASQSDKPEEQAGVGRTLADVAIKGAQGVVGLGQSAVGLADLATGGLAGKGMQYIGYDPDQTNAAMGEYLSDSQKRSDKAVDDAEGFIDTAIAAVKNPRFILGSLAQSAPGILAMGAAQSAVAANIAAKAALGTAEGAAAASGMTGAKAIQAALGTAAGKKAALTAVNAAATKLVGIGSILEGAQAAGQIADQAQRAGRNYTDYALPAIAAGMGNAAISFGTGKLLGDAATEMFTGAKQSALAGSRTARILHATGSEWTQETLQSGQEQFFTNAAMGESDLMKGVPERAAQGGVTGAVMGGALGGGSKPHAQAKKEIEDKYADQRAAVDRMRAAGDTAAADAMERTIGKKIGGELSTFELGRMGEAAPEADFHQNPVFQQQYQGMRQAGTTPAEAAARAAAVSKFWELGKAGGLSDKAITAAVEAARNQPIDTIGTFLGRYADTLRGKGMGQVGNVSPDLDDAIEQAMTAVATAIYGNAMSEEKTNAALDLMDKRAQRDLAAQRDFSPEPQGEQDVSTSQPVQAAAAGGDRSGPIDAGAGLDSRLGIDSTAASQGLDAASSANPVDSVPARVDAAGEPSGALADSRVAGSDAGNGFRHGPQNGERYRVGVVESVGGAIAIEKRYPAGTVGTFYVGKDGNLIDGDSVNLIGNGKEKLWIPATPEQAKQAQQILDEMGQLDLQDPARKDAKERLKKVVSGKYKEASVQADAAGVQPDAVAPTGLDLQAKKDALRSYVDSGKSVAVQTSGDGKISVGPSLDNNTHIQLDLTAEERKAFNRANADIELADTPEERITARIAEQTALRPAIDRAIAPVADPRLTPVSQRNVSPEAQNIDTSAAPVAKAPEIEQVASVAPSVTPIAPPDAANRRETPPTAAPVDSRLVPVSQRQAEVPAAQRVTTDWKGQPWDGASSYGDPVDSKVLPGDIGTGSKKNTPWASRGPAVGHIFRNRSSDTQDVVQVGKDAFVVRPIDKVLAQQKSNETAPSTAFPQEAPARTDTFDTTLKPDGTLSVKGDLAAIHKALAEAEIPKRSIIDTKDGVLVGKTQAAKAKAKFASKADLEHLFGIDQKRAKALDRIAKGTAYFAKESKAKEYVKDNGLGDTHEVVRHSSGANRWDVVAKPIIQSKEQAQTASNGRTALSTSEQKDNETPVSSQFTGQPDPRNTPPMQALDGYAVGDVVDIPQRTFGRGKVEVLYKRQMAGMDPGAMARVVRDDGKKLDVLTSELKKADDGKHDDLMDDAEMRGYEQRAGTEKKTAPVSRLTQARNDLMDMQAKADAQGRVVDDRLLSKIRQQQKVIKDLEAEQAAKDKMMAAAADLASLLGKNTRANITPEQEQKMLPIVIRLFEGAMELGIVKFKEAARYVREFITNAIDKEAADAIPIDTLQGAYIATARRHADKEVTPKAEVVAVNSIEELEEPGQTAPATATEDMRAAAKQAGQDVADTMYDWKSKASTRAQVELAIADYLFENMDGQQDGVLELAKEIFNELASDSKEPTSDLEKPAKTADTSTQDNPNDTSTIQQPSPETLGKVATQEGGQTSGGGNSGNGASSSGAKGIRPPAGVDGARVPGSRGPRGGAGRVGSAQAGGRRRGGAAGKSGTEEAGAGASPASGVNPEIAPANLPGANFQITDALRLGQGGPVQKFNDNLDAIRTLKTIEAERRRATPEEQSILARYVGWGGLAQAFHRPDGTIADGWADRANTLKELLTPSEFTAARQSTRNAHYTSQSVVRFMWDAAMRLGFRGGLVLEPSTGTGNFIGLAPQGLPSKFIGVEFDSLTARMAAALYPQAAVLHSGFQYVPIADGAFSLVIGNPPFGSESLRFQYKPELNHTSIHNQFFRASLDAVRPGGLQVMVVSRFLMDKQDRSDRLALAQKGELVTAIRLPDNAFQENARTEVVTDIVILRKYTASEQDDAELLAKHLGKERLTPKEIEQIGKDQYDRLLELRASPMGEAMKWVDVAQVRDPLGGEAITVNRYFAENPDKMLGTLDRSGTMNARDTVTVHLANPADLPAMLDKALQSLPTNVSNISDEVIEATQERFDQLAEALRIAVSKEEPGHLKINADGVLQRVIERESPDGGEFMARQNITPESPWSEQLMMDGQGRWYKMEVVVGDDGKPVKIEKNGKVTKLNRYERTTYATDADVPSGLRLGQAGYDRLIAAVKMRDLVKAQLVLETEDAPTAQMEANRVKLAEAYKAFTDKNGPINRPVNLRLVMTMPDGGLIAALESEYAPQRSAEQAQKTGLSEQAEHVKPAPILRERVVPKYEPATSAASPADALVISLAERGRVDMERIAKLLGVTEGQAAATLQAGEKPLVFRDPEEGTWETADAYLSGQVKRKLAAARAADLDANVKALEAVQPEPWTADQVTAQIGATWIPPDVYADFANSLVGGATKASFSKATNSFTLVTSGADQSKMEQWSVPSGEGYPGVSFAKIINSMLNSQAVVARSYPDENDVTRVHPEGTALAQLKAKEIVSEFDDWVFKDGDRRTRLVDIFNEKFNTRVTRQFDGSHLTLPGKVPDSIIAMRRHQNNAIWRGIASRFLLLDHVVGAGKTYTGIARAMERRRMGLARKPVIAVPNHLVEQWEIDVYRLYPGAKVLAAGPKDFEAKRRRRLFARIATGDWDLVIVPHTSFGFIGIAPETEQRFLEAEMKEAEAAVEEAWEQAKEDGTDQGRRTPFGVKEAERLVTKIQARMDKLREGARDRLLTFEQLGIDDLTVDEAHEFKNLYYSSRLTGVRGMGNRTGSRRAADLYNKVRVLRDNNGAVTFMTGTPISNSAVEMFTILRYLASKELDELGLTHFDAWRAQFVEATPKFEPTETGRLKEVTRLGRTWSNMRSLMDLYYSVTDAVSIDDIKQWYAEDSGGKEFPVPKVKGGGRRLVKLNPTPAQSQMLQQVIDGFDGLDDIEDPYERNIMRLRLMNVARAVSLDTRAISRSKLHDAGITPISNPDEKGGKLDEVSATVKRMYDESTHRRGTQLVFLDRSVPKARGDDKIIKEYDALIAKRDAAIRAGDEDTTQEVMDALEKFDADEIVELRTAQDGGWNAYQQIKDNLVALGIPAGEVRFIQEAATDEQKQAMFEAVRGGKVRVLIGSTPRMGAGTNVQDRLVALHHVDVTWKPSDIEQREGRIIRQGNLFVTPPTPKAPNPDYDPKFEADIKAYATERTIDAKMWDLNATKLKTINGIRKYDGAFTMEFDDEESVSMAEMAAIASGNPMLLERVTLESQISTLELLERAHRRKEYGILDAIERAQNVIQTYPGLKERAEAAADDAKARRENLLESVAGRSVTVEGQTFTEFSAAWKHVLDTIELQQGPEKKGRWSMVIDGQRVTNKEAAEEAVMTAIGDQAPFEMEVGGKTITTRSAAGKAIAAALENVRVEDDSQETVTIGKMFGGKLVADLTPTNWGEKGKILTLSLVDGGKTIESVQGSSTPRNVLVTSGDARRLVEKLSESVLSDKSGDASFYQSAIDRAKRDLPGLLKQKGQPWPKASELAEKRKRLSQVVIQLTTGQAPEPEIATSTNPRFTGAPEGNDTDVVWPGGFPAVFSRGDNGADQTTGLTPTQFTQALSEAFGAKVADRLQAKGVVVPLADQNSLPAHVVPYLRAGDVVFGFYDPRTDRTYAVLENLTPDMVKGLALHEVGVHYGFEAMLGDKKYAAVMRRLDVMEKAGQKDVVAAAKSAKENSVNPRQIPEERLAYLVQNNPEMGIVREIIAAIKAFLFREFGIGEKYLTSDDLTALAKAAVMHASRTQDGGSFVPAFAREPSIDRAPVWKSALLEGVNNINAKALTPAMWKDGLKGLVNKGLVKQDEIAWSGLDDWLTMQQGKVPKEAVLQYLQDNGVKVTETMLGGTKDWYQGYEEDVQTLKEAGVRVEIDPDDNGHIGFVDEVEEDDFMSAQEMRDYAIKGEVDYPMAAVEAALRIERQLTGNASVPKYSQYQLPGGRDYRELLLTLPTKDELPPGFEVRQMRGGQYSQMREPPWGVFGPGPLAENRYGSGPTREAAIASFGGHGHNGAVYKSSHWDQPNVLAHIRFTTREDATGAKVLFIDELQSDWGQSGKRHGFATDDLKIDGKTAEQWQAETQRLFDALPAGLDEPTTEENRAWQQAAANARTLRDRARQQGLKDGQQVPAAPFVQKTDAWVSLALKRMIRYAVDNGFDKIAFVNGEQSAERYDLSKQVRSIAWTGRGNDTEKRVTITPNSGNDIEFRVLPDGTTASSSGGLAGNEFASKRLDEVVGKDVAERIMGTPYGDMRGNGLKVGGEGMRAFYDKIVPTVAKDVLRKVGGGQITQIPLVKPTKAFPEGVQQPGFDITPAMREKASQGLPMFSKKTDQTDTPEFRKWFGDSKVVDADGRPLIVYHGTKAEFSEFMRTRGGEFGPAIYLTDSPREASEYGDGKGWGGQIGTQVMPLYVSIKNPYTKGVDAFWKEFGTGGNDAEAVAAAQAAGYDGIIAKRADRYYDNEAREFVDRGGELTHYIAFDPTQVKSAIGNNGAFDPTNPDIRFSRAADVTIAQEPYTFANRARDLFHDIADKQTTFNWWNNTVGTQYQKAQQDKHFKRVFDATQDYILDVSRLANQSADLARDLLPKLESFSDVLKDIPLIDKNATREADVKAIAKPVFQGTLSEKRVYRPEQLKRVFGLTDKQVELYKQFRQAVDKSIDDLSTTTAAKLMRYAGFPINMLQDEIEAGDHKELAKMAAEVAKEDPKAKGLAKQIAEISDRAQTLKAEGYAPLMRFGQYAVSVRDPLTKELKQFYLLESQAAANKKARIVAGAGIVEQSVMSTKDYQLLKGVSPESLELFGDILEKAGMFDTRDELFQTYLRRAIDQRSAMKRMIERHGYPGYSEDMRRVLATFVTSNARLASKNLHFSNMLEAAENIPKEKGDVRDEATALVKYVQEPVEEAPKIRGLLFANYLGGSVASALTNMTQTITMTVPYLSQFSSPLKAGAALAKGMKQAVTEVTDKDLANALAKAEQAGLVSPQEIHHLNAEAMGTFGSHPAVQKAMFLWGSLFSLAEQFNRKSTFIAAFNMARELGKRDPYAFAQQAVEETQGIYNRGNRPDWARGAIGATVFTFKQFSISYLEFLSRLPAREKVLALAILMLAAGGEGLPFADDLDDIIDTIAQKLGYNFNSKKKKREFIGSVLGQGGADFVLKGMSAIPGLPIDVSGRMGMANLIPGSGVMRKDAKDHMADALEVLGPAGGFMRDAVNKTWLPTTASELSDSAFTPVAIRNLAKSADMFQTGMYRDTKGRKVIDTTAADAIWKAIGFQPAEVARESQRARIVQQGVSMAKISEAEIADQMAQARFEGSIERYREAREKMEDWNRKNPESRMSITTDQIARRVKEMKMDREQRIIKSAPRELRGNVKAQLVQ